MTKAEKIKNLWKEWMLALAAVEALTMVCNLIGYGGNLAEPIIYWTDKIDVMASITPILAFAGVLLGKDWKAFLQIGWKVVLVSVLTIFGTFFVSGLIAQMML